MPVADRHEVPRAYAIGGEGDVVANVVAAGVRRTRADLAKAVLPVQRGSERSRAEARVEAGLDELAALFGRVDGGRPQRWRDAGAARPPAGACRPRVPDVVVGVTLQVEPEAGAVREPEPVACEQRVRAVAGIGLATVGAAIVVGVARGGAEHQCVIGARA